MIDILNVIKAFVIAVAPLFVVILFIIIITKIDFYYDLSK